MVINKRRICSQLKLKGSCVLWRRLCLKVVEWSRATLGTQARKQLQTAITVIISSCHSLSVSPCLCLSFSPFFHLSLLLLSECLIHPLISAYWISVLVFIHSHVQTWSHSLYHLLIIQKKKWRWINSQSISKR